MTVQQHRGEVIGRMPASMLITPSKRMPWYGAWLPDRRFTRQQEYVLRQRGLDPETVEAIEVRREATAKEHYFPLNSWPPLFQFDCPVIGRSGDRVRILAPDGDPILIRSDGWAHKPRTRPYTGSIY